MFSVIMATYNRGPIISKAIKSVLSQTHADLELIVVDDGSTDNTKETVEKIRDPRVRYERQSHSGRTCARNKGVELARGGYVTFLDSDDEVRPDWLQEFENAFKEDIKAGAVRCGMIVRKGEGPGAAMFPAGPHFLTGTVAFKKELFQKAGGYEAALPRNENTELAMRFLPLCVSMGWHVCSVPKPLVIYNRASLAGKNIEEDDKAELRSIEFILTRHGEFFKEDPKMKAIYEAKAGVCAARLKDYGRAGACFRSAIGSFPWEPKNYLRLVLLGLFPRLSRKIWLREYRSL